MQYCTYVRARVVVVVVGAAASGLISNLCKVEVRKGVSRWNCDNSGGACYWLAESASYI